VFFKQVAADPNGYLQAARLANLPYSLYTPLVNCLLSGIIDISDIAATPVLTERAVQDMVNEALVKHRMADYQDGDAAKLEYVYNTLNMREFIPPYLANKNVLDSEIRSMCLKWEYFSKRRAYASYSSAGEFLDEFNTYVVTNLPYRDEYSAEDKLRANFPLSGESLFESLPDPGTATFFANAYERLLSRYLPALSDSNVNTLLISSPVLKSTFETNMSHIKSLINYYFCCKNTQDVIDEIVAMMSDAPADGDEISVGGEVHMRILSELTSEDFSSSPARTLNRFILLLEAKKRIESNPDECDTDGINILLEKLMQFIHLITAINELSTQYLRVEPI
jgi:hypothetical protein